MGDELSSMKRYNLGPNGGILTSLNLFTTKFDQVLNLVEQRADSVELVKYLHRGCGVLTMCLVMSFWILQDK
jgi:hypothetical protein